MALLILEWWNLSKSLISLTQKNDIEVTQVEEYDQEKYRQQNETKEINFSTLLNTTPNNIDNISQIYKK